MKPVVSIVAVALALVPTWASAAPSHARSGEAAAVERADTARAPSKAKRSRRGRHAKAKVHGSAEAPPSKDGAKGLPMLPAPQAGGRGTIEAPKSVIEQPRAELEKPKTRDERDHGVDHGEPPILVPASLAARPHGKGVAIERTKARSAAPSVVDPSKAHALKSAKGIEPASAKVEGAHGAELPVEKGLGATKGIERAARRTTHPLLRAASAKHRADAPSRDRDARDGKAEGDAKGAKSTERRKKAKPCFKDEVELIRGAEVERFPLLTCSGDVAKAAIDRLSIVARPGTIDRPAKETRWLDGDEVVPGIRRLDSGLVARVGSIVEHFTKPGKIAKIAVVSGYRPGSTGSQHKDGKALDIRLEGVSNEEVVEFCKTLADTGCGYYPNSSFVHVDARAPGAGHVHWIDASGPGEKPRYVSAWPPPKEPESPAADEVASDEAPSKAEVALNAAPPPGERAGKDGDDGKRSDEEDEGDD